MFAIILLIGAALTGIPLSKDNVSQRCINICLIYIVAVAVYLMFIIGFLAGLIVTCCFSIYSLFQILVMYGETEKSPPKFTNKTISGNFYKATVIKKEDAHTPLPAEYVYWNINGNIISELLPKHQAPSLGYSKYITFDSLNNMREIDTQKVFPRLYPEGSEIHGIIENINQKFGTITIRFCCKCFDKWHIETALYTPNTPSFIYYCIKGNKVSAKIKKHAYIIYRVEENDEHGMQLYDVKTYYTMDGKNYIKSD